MQNKKRKRNLLMTNSFFTLPTPLEVQLTKNNYSIAE